MTSAPPEYQRDARGAVVRMGVPEIRRRRPWRTKLTISERLKRWAAWFVKPDMIVLFYLAGGAL